MKTTILISTLILATGPLLAAPMNDITEDGATRVLGVPNSRYGRPSIPPSVGGSIVIETTSDAKGTVKLWITDGTTTIVVTQQGRPSCPPNFFGEVFSVFPSNQISNELIDSRPMPSLRSRISGPDDAKKKPQ
jgi:hypothetical protein